LIAERHSPDANILTASDAIWWVFVSITTVGYGDRFPVTDQGRLIGVVTLTVGVGLFGVVTGFLANLFLGQGRKTSADE
jgi:voltage-gated potassium channel